MVIQNNLSAFNANRQLGIVFNSLEKSTEKLSSGYKINRAADDAAGLSISEKMRKQIRGLSQAAENIQDGISLCQVADGALNETVDILQRMNELSIQAANGTNSLSDRKDVQLEIDQLSSEINRIAETTKFNEIYPLKSGTKKILSSSAPSINTPSNTYLANVCSYSYTLDIPLIYDGISYQVGDTITLYGITSNGNEIIGDGFTLQTPVGFPPALVTNPTAYSVTSTDLKFDSDGYLYIDSNLHNDKWYYGIDTTINPNDSFWDPLFIGTKSSIESDNSKIFITRNMIFNSGTILPSTSNNIQEANNIIYIQAGCETQHSNKISIHFADATMQGLFSNSTNISVLNESSCSEAIEKVDKALKKVSGYRSYFGAIQNRLEHAYNINQNTVENTQFAESQIRDTDMASEMVKHSNNTILAQAGQSMLSQANQSSRGVLSLIGG